LIPANPFFDSFLAILIVIGLVYFLIIEKIRRATTYKLTNKRVILEFSLFSRRSKSALYSKLQDVEYTQSIIERIFKVGDVFVTTSGAHDIEIVFLGVKNPNKVKKYIFDHTLKNADPDD
jgi:uncharacterized membrane protein YdbT with pleckstrin-like domain